MYNKDMKPLVKYTIELDIDNICSTDGFKGGDIFKISTYSNNTVGLVKSFCHKLEIDTNVKVDKTDSKLKHIFCAFGKDMKIYNTTEDDSVYELLMKD